MIRLNKKATYFLNQTWSVLFMGPYILINWYKITRYSISLDSLVLSLWSSCILLQ